MIPQKIYKKILDYFEGNKQKADLWFRTPNHCLGDVKPIDMIMVGRIKKLEQFIDSALEGNHP